MDFSRSDAKLAYGEPGRKTPKLVGVKDVAEAEEILKEFRAQLFDELDEIKRELGLAA